MKITAHKNLIRLLPLIFSCLLVGLLAPSLAAKEKPKKRLVASTAPCQKAQVQPRAPAEMLSEEKIQEEMEKYLGIRYKRGGNSTKGFDCSGFVKQIYHEVFGIDLPHQSSEQSKFSLLTQIFSDDLKTGDLIFFSGGRKRKGINHVGIYLSDGRFIHAARSKGVIISRLSDPYWKARLVSTKRLEGRGSALAGMDSQSMLGLGTALDKKSLFTFQVTTAQIESFAPFPAEGGLFQFSRNSYYRTEFNFLKGLWSDSWTGRVTAFRESFSLPDEDPYLLQRPILRGNDDSESRFASDYTQGLRIASDIRPYHWLRVTPSITYFDYGDGVELSDLPKVDVGLDFNLVSSSDGWSLSTGFRYPLSRYASSHLFENDTADNRMIDMSLTFRQWLTDHVQFSVTGERFYRYSSEPKDSPSGLGMDDHQISLALHFFY